MVTWCDMTKPEHCQAVTGDEVVFRFPLPMADDWRSLLWSKKSKRNYVRQATVFADLWLGNFLHVVAASIRYVWGDFVFWDLLWFAMFPASQTHLGQIQALQDGRGSQLRHTNTRTVKSLWQDGYDYEWQPGCNLAKPFKTSLGTGSTQLGRRGLALLCKKVRDCGIGKSMQKPSKHGIDDFFMYGSHNRHLNFGLWIQVGRYSGSL